MVGGLGEGEGVYFLALELYTAYFSARVSTAPGGLKRMPRSFTIERAFWGSWRNR